MQIIMRWVVPIVLLAVGIAIFSGGILKQIPSATGLRPLLGIVVILFAIYRFAAVRTPRAPERRFGGERTRPWEK
jgi:uncharacterized membrane protein YfcA